MQVEDKPEQRCGLCHIPRSCYDLKLEPGRSNPDYSMPKSCRFGHYWEDDYKE